MNSTVSEAKCLGSEFQGHPLAVCCCCCSLAKSCLTLCNLMDCSTPGFSVLPYLPWSLLKFTPIESVMLSNYVILCCLLLLPSIFPSIKVFSNESVLCIRWLKYWDFNFSIIPSDEYSGFISFRIDWFDLLAVQGPLKSLLQDHRKHQFFSAQPSLGSSSHIHTWLLEKPQLWLDGPRSAK